MRATVISASKRALGKGGRGRPVTPPSLLRINAPRSDRSDCHHKTPRNLEQPTRSMNLPS